MKNMALAYLFLCAGIAMGATEAKAAEPITTDRPDIAESSLVAGLGVYQVEQGLAFEAGSSGGLSFPSLHRLGIGSNVELRLETPIVSLSGGQTTFTELAVGAKCHLGGSGELGELPTMGVIGHAIINAQGQVEPIVKLAVDTSLPLELDLGMNVGASLPPGNTAPALNYVAAVSRSLTDSLRVYVEGSGVSDAGASTQEFGVDGGLAFLIDPSLQLDVAVYKGLTASSTDWYAGFGISKRWGE